MKTKRLLITIPDDTAEELRRFADEQDVYLSLVVQKAITKMSAHTPTTNDVQYERGQTESVQVSLSETAFNLLELWSEKTSLSKSKLITYSLQNTILKGERL